MKQMVKKYLVIDLTEKYEEVFSGIRSEIETLNGEKELFYGKNHAKIDVNTDDNILLNKQLKFPTLTEIVRCVFQEGTKLYSQIYLDECLYESVVKMLEYDRINILKRIDKIRVL